MKRPASAAEVARVTVDADAIGALFNRCFASFDLAMVGGFEEPEYLPHGHPALACAGKAEIRFTRDYAASALHEAAHWCLAGRERRKRVDYGYDYIAPPRCAVAKARFFELEARVQAIESLFTEAIGMTFRASLDDLTSTSLDLATFQARIDIDRASLSTQGLPPRARRFQRALLKIDEGDKVVPRRSLATGEPRDG